MVNFINVLPWFNTNKLNSNQYGLSEVDIQTAITPHLNPLFTYIKATNSSRDKSIAFISHEVMEMMKNPKDDWQRKSKNETKLPVTFVLNRLSQEQLIKVQIYFKKQDGSVLGSGSYKTVKKSISILIPYKKEINCLFYESTILRQKGSNSVKKSDEVMNGINKKISLYNKIQEKKISQPLINYKICCVLGGHQYQTKIGLLRQEFEENWYNGDFLKMIKNNSLPLDIYDSKFKSNFSSVEKLDVLLGISDTLSYLHENNLMHCDIRSENILISIDGNEKISGVLTDFDKVMDIGEVKGYKLKQLPETGVAYEFYDECALQDFYLPSNDWYGLLLISADAFIPYLQSKSIRAEKRIPAFVWLMKLYLEEYKNISRQLKEIFKTEIKKIDLSSFHSTTQIYHQIIKIMDVIVEKNDLDEFDKKHYDKCKANMQLRKNLFDEIDKHFEASRKLYDYLKDNPDIFKNLKDVDKRAGSIALINDKFPDLLDANKTKQILTQLRDGFAAIV